MEIENPKFSFELVNRFFHIPVSSPKRVQVEITNKCNLNCKMCPKDHYKLPNKHIEFESFKEIMEKLRGVPLIHPVGWGESFLHPQFEEIIDHLNKNWHKIKVTTNGLLLNNNKAIRTAMKINYLTFSIDKLDNNENPTNNFPGHNNATAIRNIEEVLSKRNTNKRKRPFVALQSVVYKGNSDILKVIKLASNLKVDRVNLIRPYTKFDKSITTPLNKRKTLYKAAEKLGKKLNVRVDMFEYATFTGFKRFLWKNFKNIFRINSWCPRLHDFVYITIDGKVTPCCALPRHIIGDLKRQTLNKYGKAKRWSNLERITKAYAKIVMFLKCPNLTVK